jgi:hypothetical protein
MSDQVAEQNCVPLSEDTVAGTPNLDNQPEMKESAQVVASILHSRMASNRLVVLSMMVRIYWNPPAAVGRGPTMST